MRKSKVFSIFVCLASMLLITDIAASDPSRWLQRVQYKMEIDFDVTTHQFTGKQWLLYTNNSPDTLNRVFYHLYFNAFQPGSMMAERAQTIPDPDPRLKDRINTYGPHEIGYQRIQTLTQNGKKLNFEMAGTILEVDLDAPILPGQTTSLYMEFEAQVPVQTRRSGRDNREGISYSMSQWYPKLCEYDYQGWHANPYIGREFHGVWGDFEVKIKINRNYTIGGTGYLQNKESIGHGYAENGASQMTGDKLEWHFVAPEVHDFMWGADPDYIHVKREIPGGIMTHYFYQDNPEYNENWEMLPEIMEEAFAYINTHFGQYPYKQYSFVQGGDGGMEYPMATLITGHRSLRSLVGVSVHELMHSWYQMILGTNESLYAWMDEGFTSYATTRVIEHLKKKGMLAGQPSEFPYKRAYNTYTGFQTSGFAEPLSVHADHFATNTAYGRAAYTNGNVFLHQLEYVVGKEAFDRGLLRYYNTWKFKHPNPNDFIRIMEKESELELDWYKEYMVNTVAPIDYAITAVESISKGETRIMLANQNRMPMPVEVVVTDEKGDRETFYMPLRIMRGAKPAQGKAKKWHQMSDWPWTNPEYALVIPCKFENIVKVEIDPGLQMADIDRSNNSWESTGTSKPDRS